MCAKTITSSMLAHLLVPGGTTKPTAMNLNLRRNGCGGTGHEFVSLASKMVYVCILLQSATGNFYTTANTQSITR